MSIVLIEGYTKEEILLLNDVEIADYIFCGHPLILKIGTAEILGEFNHTKSRLTMELAQIEGGGEGALPLLSSLARDICRKLGYSELEWIVHAVYCAKPNLKLRRVLEKRGFKIELNQNATNVYYLIETIN